MMRVAALLVFCLLAACSGAPPTPDGGSDSGAAISNDAGNADAGSSSDAGSSCVPDGGVPDGGSRTVCTFNSDCPCDERCDCDLSTGCFCLTGPRGTGRNGVDSCDGGNQCESSLCVEGWNGYFCSGECGTSNDCKTKLPICSNVAFIGKICVRNPDGGS